MHRSRIHTELDHGEGHVGLNPHDDRFGASESGHLGDLAERVGAEGVEDVQSRDVDEDSARSMLPDLVDQVPLKSQQL